ncbi:900_t:CDS:2 [Paraglomus occultum]|uniref:900_t:CDS:1 n=1 Tax=Paraglomus occultum TaxID=144539 RepID=A0A9N9GKV7_9GLOM|nr:900_t:CDS:2 [Paraglomus occultum]
MSLLKKLKHPSSEIQNLLTNHNKNKELKASFVKIECENGSTSLHYNNNNNTMVIYHDNSKPAESLVSSSSSTPSSAASPSPTNDDMGSQLEQILDTLKNNNDCLLLAATLPSRVREDESVEKTLDDHIQDSLKKYGEVERKGALVLVEEEDRIVVDRAELEILI